MALAKEGYFVIASMRNLGKKGALEAAAHEANVNGQIEIVLLDVTNSSKVEAIIKDVIHRHNRIDVLVNNAGYAAGGFTEELPIEEWRKQFEVNFFGLVTVTTAVLPFMRKQQSGKIINISSISGKIGFPALGPYAASKFAVEGFSESLRLEMLRHGIHVVLIEPGSYKTNIWSKGLNSLTLQPNSPYVKEIKNILNYIKQASNTAPAPDGVIRQIVQAAQSPYPKLRYPVGKGIKLGIFLKNVIPWKWWERIITKRF